MFHTKRHVSIQGTGASHSFGFRWVMPTLIVGILGGCEAAPHWVNPAASDPQQQSVRELSEDPDLATLPKENQRIAVVWTAAGMNDISSFVVAPQTSSAFNGTGTFCPRPPCGIEPRSDAGQKTVTVHFDLRSYYYARVLDEPILTMMGIRKGSATPEASAVTFGPLDSISLNDVDHMVAITVDASDFVDISSATLSWISKEQSFGGGTSQDLQAGCKCCEYDNCPIVNGQEVCTCIWWVPSSYPCP